MRCFFGYHDWTPSLTDEQMRQVGIRRRICRRCAAIREYKWPYGPADLKEGEMSGMSMEEKAADHYHYRLKLAQERIQELTEALRRIATAGDDWSPVARKALGYPNVENLKTMARHALASAPGEGDDDE